jgi:aromatic ring-cleaving dioxygenase
MGLTWLLAFFCLAAAHTDFGQDGFELSAMYREYQKAAISGKQCEVVTRDVLAPTTSDADANPFFLPFPHQSSVDFHPQLKVLPKPSDPITYYSWHIHVYFFQEDKNVTDRALSLRGQFMEKYNAPVCTGNCFMGGPFDNCTQGMCLWEPFFVVDGPHPYGQWGVFLPNEQLASTLSWLSLNHGEFPVLFHPNTGLMVGDHDPTKRAIWIKQQVPLDLDFLIWLQVKICNLMILIYFSANGLGATLERSILLPYFK